MSSKNQTQVIIAGKIYTLSGYESEEYLQRVAAHLNSKLNELRSLEGYQRLSPELRATLLELNLADDYFKMKSKADELDEGLGDKDKDIYELRHELISAQIKLENEEKHSAELEEKNEELSKEIIRLEAQIRN